METSPEPSRDAPRPEAEVQRSADASKRGVTLRVTNSIQSPTFNIKVNLPYVPRSSLYANMERAAEKDPRFKFTVTYYGPQLGYFVNAINQLQADYDNHRTFWRLADSAGRDLDVGISNYVPRDGETIQFIFARSEACSGTSSSTRRYGVTLRAINSTQAPHFESDVTLSHAPGSSLYSYLEKAAEEDERFRFTVSYLGKTYGYYLDGLNGLKADYDADKTWWKLDYSDTPGPTVGISSHVPRDGETIQFIFTKGPKSDDNFRPRPGVKLRVINSAQEPTFDFYTVQSYVPRSALRSYLERAAEENRKFRFTARYDGQTQEYTLTGINNLQAEHATNTTSWRIADSEGTALPEGTNISNYVPRDEETIQFVFTRSEADCPVST